MKSKSIMQTERKCYLCGYDGRLETHHCMNGRPGRKLSDEYGLTVWLCPDCHRNIHADYKARERLKQEAQLTLMKANNWSVDDFRAVFYKSYL